MEHVVRTLAEISAIDEQLNYWLQIRYRKHAEFSMALQHYSFMPSLFPQLGAPLLGPGGQSGSPGALIMRDSVHPPVPPECAAAMYDVLPENIYLLKQTCAMAIETSRKRRRADTGTSGYKRKKKSDIQGFDEREARGLCMALRKLPNGAYVFYYHEDGTEARADGSRYCKLHKGRTVEFDELLEREFSHSAAADPLPAMAAAAAAAVAAAGEQAEREEPPPQY